MYLSTIERDLLKLSNLHFQTLIHGSLYANVGTISAAIELSITYIFISESKETYIYSSSY